MEAVNYFWPSMVWERLTLRVCLVLVGGSTPHPHPHSAPPLSLSLVLLMTRGASSTRFSWQQSGSFTQLHLFPFGITYLLHTSRFSMSSSSSCWQLEPWRSLQPHFSKLSRAHRIIWRVFCFHAESRSLMNLQLVQCVAVEPRHWLPE